MPSSADHSYITQNAMELVPDAVFPPELSREYCHYPDLYFSMPDKMAKYHFETNGIQFHYPPIIPYCELYRYWRMEHGHCIRKPFRNVNFTHMHRGFLHYIKAVLAEPEDECWKYAGCLIHALQDAQFGVHVLENAGGADINFLNRLGYFKQDPAIVLLDYPATGYQMLEGHAPSVLGRNAQEFALNLYSKYVLMGNISRTAGFRAIMEREANGSHDAAYKAMEVAFSNAVILSADVLYTLRTMRTGCAKELFTPVTSMTELVPIEFTFGGGGSAYIFDSYTIDEAYNKQGTKIPLETMANGTITPCQRGFAFGVHVMGEFMFRLPSNCYKTFTATIGLHPQCDDNNSLSVFIFNAGRQIDELRLNGINDARSITIPKPRGKFGFKILSMAPLGVVVVAEPRLVT